MKISISKSSIKTLSELKTDQFRSIPSEKVYYGTFPYRVKLSAEELPFLNLAGNIPADFHTSWYWRTTGQVHDVLMLGIMEGRDLEIGKFDLNNFHNRVSHTVYNNTQAVSVYCKHPDTVSLIMKKYPTAILEIAGPIHEEHKDDLWNPDIDVRVKNTLWWNKYDSAYTFFVRWKYIKSMYKMTDVHRDIKNWLVENLETVSENSHRLSSVRWQAKIFGSKSEIEPLIPFILLQWGHIRMTTHKLYIIDK